MHTHTQITPSGVIKRCAEQKTVPPAGGPARHSSFTVHNLLLSSETIGSRAAHPAHVVTRLFSLPEDLI